MQCPHCRVSFHSNLKRLASDIEDKVKTWWIEHDKCPTCLRSIVLFCNTYKGYSQTQWRFVEPASYSRPDPGPHVPTQFKEDFSEAAAILEASPQASAALSRRILQDLLHNKVGIRKANLAQEIEEFIKSPGVPESLATSVDAVRNIGNFSAHPIKSLSTGMISKVEPGEAEWILGVIEELFDHLFTKPAIRQAKLDALNQKLQDAGKPPLKTPPP